MQVIEYLNKNGKASLKNNHGIKIREYPLDNLMTLNYSLLDSIKFNAIADECRALILENTAPYNVVARSFDRFYNLRQNKEVDDSINFNNAIVWEKIDGSLCNFYYYKDKWNVSTRSMAFAEGLCNNGLDTFEELIMGYINRNNINLYKHFDKDITYMCEFVSPLNRIVKPYQVEKVYLLGARDKNNGKEHSYESLLYLSNAMGLDLPTTYEIKDYQSIIDMFKNIDAFDEGFIVADYSELSYVKRVKLKNPSYLAISFLRSNGVIPIGKIIDLVFLNDTAEYLDAFPEDKPLFAPYIHAYEYMIQDIHETIDKTKHILDRKEFAEAIKDSPVKTILFKLKSGENIEDVLSSLLDQTKRRILKQYIK